MLKKNYAQLFIGGLLMVFYNANAVSIAAWLAPLFILRFTRSCSRKELLMVPLVLAVSHAFLLYEPFSNAAIPPLFRIAFGLVCGQFIFIPFMLDRWLAGRIDGFKSTLVFPAAWVSVEFLFSKVSPLATFGVIGYTQIGCLPLIQIVSITGIWGLSFIVIWFSSVADGALRHPFDASRVKKGIAIYTGILLVVILYGEWRIRHLHAGQMVRITAASSSYDGKLLFRQALKTGEYPPLSQNIAAIDTLLANTAGSLARIIFWKEYAIITGTADEAMIIEHARSRAKEIGIYLGLPMGVVKEKDPKPILENKVVWIDPKGRIEAHYIKSYTAPWETSSNQEKKISTFKTAFGVIGSVICFDMDFPSLIRQAGRNGVECMLVPAYDWRGIAPFHSHMAVFRAIENGFSLIRAAGESGVSIATDPCGRILAYMDNAVSQQKIMTIEVPFYSIKTGYSVIGDFLAWLSIGGLGCLTIMHARFSK